MKKLLLAAAALVALGAAGQAQATCVSSTQISAPDPGAGTTCSITADASTVDIVFAYKSAADVDLLLNGVSLLISNQDALGTEATITGLTVGQVLDFVFTNQTTGDSFQAGIAASDGKQHIAVQSTYADFQTDRTSHVLDPGGPGRGVRRDDRDRADRRLDLCRHGGFAGQSK